MALYTADRIHNGLRWLPQGSVIEVTDDGTVVAIHDGPKPGTTTVEGILAPGFVNVHCHLELSHMKGVVPKHTGLIPFLKTIPTHRNNFTDEQKKAARNEAYNELLRNGVVAVGDIANTTETLDLRAMRALHYFTFVETIGFTPAFAQKAFDNAVATYTEFAAQDDEHLGQSIIPHAPYSVSAPLFRLIDSHDANAIISIHNQESMEEDKFYTRKEGQVRDLLSGLGIDDTPFTASGRSSLQTYSEWLSPTHPLILVHNTYTQRADVQKAHGRFNQVYWCLCPNANLYIENTLPDIEMLMHHNACICIGTDSLASNTQLSVLAELSAIKAHYPDIEWETLLSWGTCNGAKALGMQDKLGTIEAGKKPGVVHITRLNGVQPVVKRLF